MKRIEAQPSNKSNKLDNDLYPLLNAGQLVELDKDFANSGIVEVVSQTPRRLYTRVKAPNGYEWDVMTNRLTICD
jgi:hypothetical protein